MPIDWPKIGSQVKEKFLEGIGYASERRGCENYIKCTVRCVGKVVGIELATSGALRKLEKAAQVAAAARAAAWIAGAGTYSTALSGMQAVTCTWKCAKR